MLTAVKGQPFDNALSLMQRLAAKYPIYYGMGNHEYRLELYPDIAVLRPQNISLLYTEPVQYTTDWQRPAIRERPFSTFAGPQDPVSGCHHAFELRIQREPDVYG